MYKKQRIVLRQLWGQAPVQARADGEFRASLPNQGMHVSVPTAYLWFAFSGMLGGHRIYMGRKLGMGAALRSHPCLRRTGLGVRPLHDPDPGS